MWTFIGMIAYALLLLYVGLKFGKAPDVDYCKEAEERKKAAEPAGDSKAA